MATGLASGNVDTVLCPRCGDAVSSKRWDAHRDLWCPRLDDDGSEEAEAEAEEDTPKPGFTISTRGVA